MKTYRCLMMAAVSLFLCAQAQETSAQEPKRVEGDVLVKFTIEITPEQGPNGEIIVGIPSVDSLNLLYGLVSMSQVYRGPLPIAKKLWKLVFPPEIDEPAVARVYSLDPYIDYAQPNYLLRVADTWPNDTYRDSCWYHRDSLRYLQSRLAWDYTTGSDTVIISIDDTGVHWKHDDLSGNPAHPGNIWENLAEDADSDGTVLEWAFTGEDWEWIFDPGDINGEDDSCWGMVANNYPDDFIGYDFFFDDNNPEPDSHHHGTMMAGIASAVTDNEIGTVGMTWNCKIMCCKAGSGNDYEVPTENIAEAIYYTVNEHLTNYPGARVINISAGEHHYDPWPLVEEAIDTAYAYGVLTVAAATNRNTSDTAYPASYAHALGVAATGHNDGKVGYSNFGDWVDVCAPTGTWTTFWRPQYAKPDTYGYSGGTSSSAPLVSGIVALMWSYNPDWPIDTIWDRIKGTVDNVNHVNPYHGGLLGTGRVNAWKALTMDPQPNVFLQKWDISDGSGGMTKEAYAGRDNRMVITMENVWKDAESVVCTLTLRIQDQYVTLLDSIFDYGPIPQYGTASNATPYRFHVDAGAPQGHSICFRLKIAYDGYARTDDFTVKVGVPYQPGFPVCLEGPVRSSPAVVDLNGDGYPEIVIGSDAHKVFAIDSAGTVIWHYLTGGEVRSSPAVADIDKDGFLEIVVGSSDDSVYCLTNTGSRKWTAYVNGAVYTTPALENLNRDSLGLLEVVVSSDDGRVYAITSDGTPYWTSDDLVTEEIDIPVTSPAVGELDERPLWHLDVVVGTSDGEIVALNGEDGSILWRRDMADEPIYSAPALGDLTKDGCLEIAFGVQDTIWVLRDDSTTLSGDGYEWPYYAWPSQVFRSSPALADIDGDDTLEVIIGGTFYSFEGYEHGYLFVPNARGDSLVDDWWGGYDVSYAIGDIDGDAGMDVVAGGVWQGSMEGLYAYKHAGSHIPGFPIYTFERIQSCPAIADLDGDGTVEVIVGCDNDSLYVWDCQGTYNPENMEWDTYRGNLRRTARYEPDFPPLGSTSDLATAYNGGRKLARVPNSDDLWITYQTGGRVFVIHSTDGGETWFPRTKLGWGEFPTVALDGSGNPHVVWIVQRVEPDGWDIRYARFDGEDWGTYTLCSYDDPARPYLPSMVIDLTDWAHLTWETWHLAERHLYYGQFTTAGTPYVTPELVYQCPDQTGSWFMSPCIALDFLGEPHRPHIVYREGSEGEIYYTTKDGTWSPPYLISQSNFTSNFPFIEIWGDIIHALWAGHDPLGTVADEIWYRSKPVHAPSWTASVNVSESPGDTSQFPVAAAKYASWSENCLSSNWEIMSRLLPAGPLPENISQTPARSMYSHINYRQPSQEPQYLYFAWTEGDGPGYSVTALEYPLYHPPVPYYYVETGQEETSFYCVQRDSFIQFGPEAYKQVDVDSTKLLYHLPGLKPCMRYRLIVTGYWQGDDEIEERLDMDGLASRLIKLQPDVPETVKIWVPPAAYEDDKSVDVNIALIDGDWAVIGPMTLYEFERDEEEGDGGPQITGVRPLMPKVFALSQSYPNPATGNATIRYALPKEVEVNLRIYNAAGRLVTDLLDERQRPGFYSVSWDGRDSFGRHVASGVYFYRLRAGEFESTRKAVLLR